MGNYWEVHEHAFSPDGDPRARRLPGRGRFVVVMQPMRCDCGAVRVRSEVRPRVATPRIVRPRVARRFPDRTSQAAIVHRYGRTVRHDRCPAMQS